MILLASASTDSTATSAAYFARWIDHSTWKEWSPDTEWVRLKGKVALGAEGILKPVNGPQVHFVISALRLDREYTDTSRFPGARLVFQHVATPVDRGAALDVNVSLTGPLAWLWKLILGGGFRESVPADLERLKELVEAAS